MAFDKDFLRMRRKFCELTQKELAAKIGVTGQAVFYWERGTSEPRGDKIRMLAEVLDCPASYFTAGAVEDTGDALAQIRAVANSDMTSDQKISLIKRILKETE